MWNRCKQLHFFVGKQDKRTWYGGCMQVASLISQRHTQDQLQMPDQSTFAVRRQHQYCLRADAAWILTVKGL